jgi:hypothetical protein
VLTACFLSRPNQRCSTTSRSKPFTEDGWFDTNDLGEAPPGTLAAGFSFGDVEP